MTPAAAAEALQLAQADGTGRFKAEMRAGPSILTHTVFAPRNVARAGKMPILLWGKEQRKREEIFRKSGQENADHSLKETCIRASGHRALS